MRLVKTLACVLGLAAYSLSALALDYPSALPNHDLKEEIEEQNDRLIPNYDWFSASVDGQLYLRNLEAYDFYHAVGYWIQARTEFRPSEFFKLNVRSVFYSGSISGGYTNPTGQYNLFGLTATLPTPLFGGKLQARAMDLERQTIGEGLFIEEREMGGIWTMWSRDNHYIKYLIEGTGGLVLGDDLNNIEFKLFGGLIGGGFISWTAGKQSDLSYNRDPYSYLSSSYAFNDHFGYFAEFGSRNKKYAYMAGLQTQGVAGRLKYKARLQYRHYDDLFGKDFVRSIDNMYISYDQYNKRYTTTGNVFTRDDNANVYSLIADFDYELNHHWVLQSKNEIGQFDYKSALDRKFYFYRAGITYFVMEDREESVTVFASNKVLSDSFMRPERESSVNKTEPLFFEKAFLGAEVSFRF